MTYDDGATFPVVVWDELLPEKFGSMVSRAQQLLMHQNYDCEKFSIIHIQFTPYCIDNTLLSMQMM